MRALSLGGARAFGMLLLCSIAAFGCDDSGADESGALVIKPDSTGGGTDGEGGSDAPGGSVSGPGNIGGFDVDSCLAAAANNSGGGGGSISGGATPTAEVLPEALIFPNLEIGDSTDREVTVANVGAGSLALQDILFGGNAGGEEFEVYYAINNSTEQRTAISRDGELLIPTPVVLEPCASIRFIVNYRPADAENDDGALVIRTNERGRRTIEIDIRTGENEGELRVSPSTIDFGRVPAGTTGQEKVTITNVGFSTILFTQVLVNESPDFTAQFNGTDIVADPSALGDPDGDGSPGLAAGGAFEVDVIYAPPTEGPDRGSLVFETEGAPSVAVNLLANGATPCIKVTPEDGISFPPSLINRTSPRPLNIESCGGEPLEITNIFLTDDSAAEFELEPSTLPTFPALLPARAEGGEAPSRTITVNFTPRAQEVYGGKIVIESNDPIAGRIEVPLSGAGVLNECPEAIVAADEFTVLPLDVVDLDGSASVDPDGPDGRPVRYQWVVTQRPMGSTAEPVERFNNPVRPQDGGPVDDPTTPLARFFVDLAGDYTLELRVTDNLDLSAPSDSCEAPNSIVRVHATPNEDIHVQLVWRTPADPDETDTEGTDVDLHVLHPNGQNWFSAPLDNYFANPNPDWGRVGDDTDDPSLDIDDVNGAGPENINLDNPENTAMLGGQYRVGVHYYRSDDIFGGRDWGPSFVTLRVFLGGVPAFDNTVDGIGMNPPGEKQLRQTDDFWEAVGIIWTPDDRRVVPIDILRQNFRP